MNNADFNTQPNGFPLESDATLGFMQTDYQSAIRGLGAYFGDLVIISGMVETGANVSSGWIMVGGDLVFFQGGAKQATFVITTTSVSKANQNGTLVARYFTKKAQFGTGSGQYNYSALQRLEGIQTLQNRLLDLVLFEPEVILAGCAVSSVNTGASTLQIAAGVAVINRKFINVPAYTGGYPIYLKEDGTWANTAPVSNFIAFNPYTSQRLADVVARSTTPTGDLKMRVALSDRFDSTGLGRWEMKGYAICNGANGTVDLRSRFPVAYDNRNSDPGGNLWDPAYNTPGNTGGEKGHTLSVAEMPAHNHTSSSGATGDVAAGDLGVIKRSVAGQNVTMATPDAFGSGDEPDIINRPQHLPLQGGGQAHENRPPFNVVVFIQRI